MKRITKILIVAIMGMLAMSTHAQMSSHMLQSRPYSELYIDGAVTVECRQSADSAGLIVFSATPELFKLLRCYNVGERLNITLSKTGTKNVKRDLSKIVVYYSGRLKTVSFTGSGGLMLSRPPLEKSVAVLLTGSGRIKASSIEVSHLSCSVAGSGNLALTGKTVVDNVTSSVSGSGAIEISDIKAQMVSATVNGAGDFIINGSAGNASFALKGSGSIDASSLDCEKMTAGAYGSGKIFHSRRVTDVNAVGKKNNIIVR